MPNLIAASDLTAYAPDMDLTAFGGASSATVSGIISQASAAIVNYCNVAGFDLAAVTSERNRAAISSMGELIINFKRRPVADGAVSAVRLVKGGFSTTLTLTNNGNSLYQIVDGTRFYYPSTYLAAAGTLIIGGSSQLVTLKGADVFVEVDYTGGYQTIPADLKQATILWVRDIINTQFNNSGATSFTQGSYTVNYGAGADTRIIKQAKAILNQGDYVRVVTI